MSDALVLKGIIERAGVKVSDSGVAWLGSALNPFSDYQQELVGFPDSNAQPSVVMMYSSQSNVTAPISAAGGNYDCYVVSTSMDADSTSTGFCANVNGGNVVYNSSAYATHVFEVHPLTIMTGPANSDVSPLSTAGTEFVQGLNSRNVPNMFGRVIAQGFEVTNTTAEIYKQGTVTCALVPAVPDQDVTLNLIDSQKAASDMPQHCKINPRFPVNIAELTAIPQSCRWEAAKGAYVVPRLSGVPAVERSDAYAGLFFYDDTHQAAFTPSTGFNPAPTIIKPTLTTSAHNSFSNAVAYFQGLSNQTTLTVTYRTIMEYFPDANSQLITQASPSAVYDPFVMQIYNEAVKTAPFAVPVGQNAAGDFFRKVLGAVRYAAPTIAAAISIPFPRAGNVVAMTGKMANASYKVMQKQKAKRARKRTPAVMEFRNAPMARTIQYGPNPNQRPSTALVPYTGRTR